MDPDDDRRTWWNHLPVLTDAARLSLTNEVCFVIFMVAVRRTRRGGRAGRCGRRVETDALSPQVGDGGTGFLAAVDGTVVEHDHRGDGHPGRKMAAGAPTVTKSSYTDRQARQ